MKIKTAIIFSVALSILTFSLVTFQQQGSLDDGDSPTDVELGKRNEREKKYSKHLRKNFDPSKSIPAGISEAKRLGKRSDLVLIVESELNLEFLSFDQDRFLQLLVCTSDAVVFGTVKSKVAHLTADESWVYTEYGIQVEDIVKNNLQKPIQQHSTIYFGRTGGKIKAEGYVVNVENSSFKQLKKNGSYVLFLKYLPDVDAYFSVNPFADFLLSGKKFEAVSTPSVTTKLNKYLSYPYLINTLKSTLNSCKSVDQS
ncbi:MAG: hypothetical protein ACK5NT_01120 [Pyrinomonadaceae bacterium]